MHDETEELTAPDALDDPERPIPFPPQLLARAVDRLDELETLAALNEALAEVDRGEGSSGGGGSAAREIERSAAGAANAVIADCIRTFA